MHIDDNVRIATAARSPRATNGKYKQVDNAEREHVHGNPHNDNLPIIFPTRESRSGSIRWIGLIGAMIVCALSVYVYYNAQDNDMWWIFATGRYIVENGIPYVNPFDVYGDQRIVVQQWIPCVVSFLLYDRFGFYGIGALAMCETLALAASMRLLAGTIMDKRYAPASWLPIALVVWVCTSYISVRPQVVSMIMFVLILYVMERYRRSDDKRLLVWLPVIVAAHANLHMSMMPFDMFIVTCYAIPGWSGRRCRTALSAYAHAPVIIIVPVMCLCSLLNPYGVDGAMYLVNSLGAASYGDYISEMGSTPTVTAYYGVLMIATIVLGSVSIGKLGFKRLNVPLTVLFIVTLFLSFQHTRNVWLVSVFSLPLILTAMSRMRMSPRRILLMDDEPKIITMLAGIALLLIAGVLTTSDVLLSEPSDSKTTPVKAASYISQHQGTGDDAPHVFTHFNAGGYMEWSGCKVGMDARPELWNDKVSHTGEDRYKDYIDMSKGDMSSSDYMRGKSFDYMIVNKDTDLYKYISSSSGYAKVLDGNGYSLFASTTSPNVR